MAGLDRYVWIPLRNASRSAVAGRADSTLLFDSIIVSRVRYPVYFQSIHLSHTNFASRSGPAAAAVGGSRGGSKHSVEEYGLLA